MFLSRFSLALTAVALAPVLDLTVSSPATAAVAGDAYMIEEQVLGNLAPDTHKAVQEALKAKGYYSGAVDGNFGPMSRKAVLKFRADKHLGGYGRAALKLDAPLVEALFGIRDFAVEGWEDQHCLLTKLGKITGAGAGGACSYSASSPMAGPKTRKPQPDLVPGTDSGGPAPGTITPPPPKPISCAAATPECEGDRAPSNAPGTGGLAQ